MSVSRLAVFLVLATLSISNAYDLTGFDIGGSTCWKEECLIGNLLADAALYCSADFFLNPTKDASMGYTDIIGFWNSGSMSGRSFNLVSNITDEVVDEWLDGDKDVSFVIILGKDLQRLLEISATARNEPYINHGQFLHVSQNAKITYRQTNGVATFSKFEVRCLLCASGAWIPLDPDYNYHIVVPTEFLNLEKSGTAEGGAVVAGVPIGTIGKCIQNYVGHMPNGLQSEHVELGRVVIDTSNIPLATEEQQRIQVEIQMPLTATSTTEIALLSVTVVLTLGLIFLGVANIYMAANQKRSFQQHSLYSSRQELTSGKV